MNTDLMAAMQREIPKHMRTERARLAEAIQYNLQVFSASTGLTVRGVRWETHDAKDARGNTVERSYGICNVEIEL